MNFIIGRPQKRCLIWLLVLVVAMTVLPGRIQAQVEVKQPAVDMMLIIDNSCSMFPEALIPPGRCTWFGNDPDFLRIKGANVFIARLGFAENNEEDYQIGAVSMGEKPPILYPLRPIMDSRDPLAREIAKPDPQTQTEVIPALEAAYEELLNSPRRKLGNIPAIVFLTDGVPFPAETNTQAQIEAVVAAHPDVPVFTILLKDRDAPAAQGQAFDDYSAFWERLGRTYDNTDTYKVDSADQLVSTYNEIVGRLQNTFTGPEQPLTPNVPLPIFVNSYVQRLILTFVHEDAENRGTIEIRDPDGNLLQLEETGVQHFAGEANPVEVVAIGSERLDRSLRDADWTVMSDTPVSVFLDYEGAYDIRFVEPQVSATPLLNRYLAVNRHSPARELIIRFQLVDDAGAPLLDPQPISGVVVDPEGMEQALRIPVDLAPNAEGVYEVAVDLAAELPSSLDTPGRYMFTINAGVANEMGEEAVPIARADLLLDIGRGAFLQSALPNPIVCQADTAAVLSITAGDIAAAQPGSIRLRVLAAGKDLAPTLGEDGKAEVDLSEICQTALSGVACSTESASSVRIRISSLTADGAPAPASELIVPIQVIAPACTPTPTSTATPSATPTPSPTATATPTATPSPTPTATPIPDTDLDTLLDPSDSCPETAQWSFAPYFQGCPPPLWLLILAPLAGLGLLALLVWFVALPLWLRASPPPDAWVLVCDGRGGGQPRSIRAAGFDARRRRVTIGPRGNIRVAGLTKTFVVETRGKRPVVVEQGKKGAGTTIYDQQGQLSDGRITLKFSTDRNKLRC